MKRFFRFEYKAGESLQVGWGAILVLFLVVWALLNIS